jgi:hypothetical protein
MSLSRPRSSHSDTLGFCQLHDAPRKRQKTNKQTNDNAGLCGETLAIARGEVLSAPRPAASSVLCENQPGIENTRILRYRCYVPACNFNSPRGWDICSHLFREHRVTDLHHDQIIAYDANPGQAMGQFDLESEASPARSSVLGSISAAPKSTPISKDMPLIFDTYVKDNTHVMFFSPEGQTTTRLFHDCNTVPHLFALSQGSKVLAIQIVDEEEKLHIVENDKNHFDACTMQLKKAPSWKMVDDKVRAYVSSKSGRSSEMGQEAGEALSFRRRWRYRLKRCWLRILRTILITLDELLWC